MKTAVYVKTKLGKNLGKMLDYVGNDNRKPHYKSKNPKFLKSNLNHHDRVLDVAGVNCSSNYKEAIKEMDSTYKRFGYKKGHPQCVHTIIAFNPKDFDFTNYKDRTRALSMTQEIIRKKYPHNQSMIALQADNKNHILHTHTITCNKTIDSGKSVSHDASCERTIPYVQEIMNKHGYDVYNPFKKEAKPEIRYTKHGKKLVQPNNAVRLKKHPKLKISTNEFNLIKGNKKSYVTEIKSHFALAIASTTPTPSKSKNIQNLIRNSQSNGIQLSCFSMRKNKRTGQHEIHYYKNPPKHRAVKLPNGWARLRKTWSLKYHYKYKNKKGNLINKPITIRTSKMGSSFSPNNIMNSLGSYNIITTIKAKLVDMQPSISPSITAANVNLDPYDRKVAKSLAKFEKPNNTSSVTSSASVKPNESAMESKVSNDTKNMMNFNHHDSTQHFHKHNVQTSTIGIKNNKESKVVHSLDNEAQQTNKSVAASGPVMSFNHNQSSASSESEDDEAPIHIKFNYKDKQAKQWTKTLSPMSKSRKRNIPVGDHYWEWNLTHFKVPYFNNHHLEALINQYENEGTNEEKQALDNFQAKCDNADKQAISTRLTTDNKINLVNQSKNDFYKDKREMKQAKINQINQIKRNGLER